MVFVKYIWQTYILKVTKGRIIFDIEYKYLKSNIENS